LTGHRWVTEIRENVREYYNRYYEAHRNEVNARFAVRRNVDPEGMRSIIRQLADRNQECRAELQRNWCSGGPEIYQSELDANAAARRLKRSPVWAGLPPKLMHVTTAGDRRANEREADAYYGDPFRLEHARPLATGATFTPPVHWIWSCSI
jgi:hypothetical protein